MTRGRASMIGLVLDRKKGHPFKISQWENLLKVQISATNPYLKGII